MYLQDTNILVTRFLAEEGVSELTDYMPIDYDVFFFNDTATTEIYTLSLHDALPICNPLTASAWSRIIHDGSRKRGPRDRKSTRLNSSHPSSSYAVFCLKKKNQACRPWVRRSSIFRRRSISLCPARSLPASVLCFFF